MSKYKKNEDILPSMSNLQPNWYLKIDFHQVDQQDSDLSKHITQNFVYI